MLDQEFEKELSAAIKKSVLPVLKNLDCDLTIAIDYVPDASLNIRISTVPELYKEENWKEI